MVSACAQSVISSIESSDSILSDVNSLKSITKIQSLRQSFYVFHNYRCEKQINKLNWIHKQRNNNITPAPIERMKCLFVCSEICHVDERFYKTTHTIESHWRMNGCVPLRLQTFRMLSWPFQFKSFSQDGATLFNAFSIARSIVQAYYCLFMLNASGFGYMHMNSFNGINTHIIDWMHYFWYAIVFVWQQVTGWAQLKVCSLFRIHSSFENCRQYEFLIVLHIHVYIRVARWKCTT